MQKDAARIKKFKNALRFPFSSLRNKGFLMLVPDAAFLKLYFRFIMGRRLDLRNPRTFNEKIQWLKLYNRNPAYTRYADKYLVRDHVRSVAGEEYLIPLLGVWERVEDIDFSSLPDRFVLKCTHDSGGVIVVDDKSQVDSEWARKRLADRLSVNYYEWSREWAYRDIQPRVICEAFLNTDSGDRPSDYKIHCFNGEPKNIMVCAGRESGQTAFILFDCDWNRQTFIYSETGTSEGASFPRPEKLEVMLNLARDLAKDMPFVRVDLYYEGGRVYFGEMTMYPESGFDWELLPETDRLWGDALLLPGKSG